MSYFKAMISFDFNYTDPNPGSDHADWAYQVDLEVAAPGMDSSFTAHNSMGGLVYVEQTVPNEDKMYVSNVDSYRVWIDHDGGEHGGSSDVHHALTDEVLLGYALDSLKGTPIDWEIA